MNFSCAYHPDQKISNFCSQKDCCIPLCPLCVPIHQDEHYSAEGQPRFLDIGTAFQEFSSSLEGLSQQIAQGRNIKTHRDRILIEIGSSLEKYLKTNFDLLKQAINEEISRKEKELTQQVGQFMKSIKSSKISENKQFSDLENILTKYQASLKAMDKSTLQSLILFYRDQDQLKSVAETIEQPTLGIEDLYNEVDLSLDVAGLASIFQEWNQKLEQDDFVAKRIEEYAERDFVPLDKPSKQLFAHFRSQIDDEYCLDKKGALHNLPQASRDRQLSHNQYMKSGYIQPLTDSTGISFRQQHRSLIKQPQGGGPSQRNQLSNDIIASEYENAKDFIPQQRNVSNYASQNDVYNEIRNPIPQNSTMGTIYSSLGNPMQHSTINQGRRSDEHWPAFANGLPLQVNPANRIHQQGGREITFSGQDQFVPNPMPPSSNNVVWNSTDNQLANTRIPIMQQAEALLSRLDPTF